METGKADSWEEIYATRFADIPAPPTWPTNIKPLSINGLSLLGIDPSSGEAYWDGEEASQFAASEATRIGLHGLYSGTPVR